MILIVENDAALATQVAELLSVLKKPVITASSISQARAVLADQEPEVVVLDRVLGDGDGLEILEDIILDELPSRVLVLSTLGEVQERIKGLERGADEYLPKPFSRAELLLRVKNLLVRKKETPGDELTLGKLTIKPETGELQGSTHQNTLRKKEMQIFASLVRYKNQVLSRDKLIELVWGTSEYLPTHATLDVYIRRIRIALGTEQHLIETVRGFGYRALER